MNELHRCESGLEIRIPCGLCENAQALIRDLANILDDDGRLFVATSSLWGRWLNYRWTSQRCRSPFAATA